LLEIFRQLPVKCDIIVKKAKIAHHLLINRLSEKQSCVATDNNVRSPGASLPLAGNRGPGPMAEMDTGFRRCDR